MPSLEPVELIAVAFNVYRRFATWLKKKGLIRLADADDSYEKEDPLASCLRGSLGIGKVVELMDDNSEALASTRASPSMPTTAMVGSACFDTAPDPL